ncbi:hypothetical protein BV20DRAFT_467670 [Pilatotrama ljubarskyi]|nr:hypothetical protein BV20DRAFT_467670 [Pilatotrama ljubarskyi]
MRTSSSLYREASIPPPHIARQLHRRHPSRRGTKCTARQWLDSVPLTSQDLTSVRGVPFALPNRLLQPLLPRCDHIAPVSPASTSDSSHQPAHSQSVHPVPAHRAAPAQPKTRWGERVTGGPEGLTWEPDEISPGQLPACALARTQLARAGPGSALGPPRARGERAFANADSLKLLRLGWLSECPAPALRDLRPGSGSWLDSWTLSEA